MKNPTIPFLLFFILIFQVTAFTQSQEISEAARALNGGTYNSFMLGFQDVSQKTAEEAWKKLMNTYKAKTKYDRKQEVWVSDKAKIPGIAGDKISVYAKILEDSNPDVQTSVIAWFDLGGSYLNSESNAVAAAYARELLSEYARKTAQDNAQSLAKAEENKMKDLENTLKKQRKENEDYHREIEKAKQTIAEMEKNIGRNEQDQLQTEQEIAAQKEVLDAAQERVKKLN